MRDRDHNTLGGTRRVAAVIALAVTLTVAPAAASAASFGASAAQAPGLTMQFGANTGVLFNSGDYSQSQIDSQLAALARTGATVVRSDALWEEAEPQQPIGFLHRYDWSFDDRIVGSLAAHGLQWLPIIDYSAPWARSSPGHDHSPPSVVSDYADYAAALAARYGPGGLYWLENPQLPVLPVETYEIWNEPDNPQFWYPKPDPGAYASLYTAARAAITAAQPEAQVIVGGLTDPASFLARMLDADPGAREQIDGVGIHPYAATPAGVLAGVRAARLAMRADGLASVPLYVTEFGWTTHERGARAWAPERDRPGYIAATLAGLAHSDCGLAAVLLYAWTTPESDPADDQDWFGISPPGAGPSPDTAAFTSALQAAAALAPVTPLCSEQPPARPSDALPRDRRRAPRSKSQHRRARARGSTGRTVHQHRD